MLAVVGYLTTAAGIRFPGAGDVPAGLKAFDYLLASPGGHNIWWQMLAFMAVAFGGDITTALETATANGILGPDAVGVVSDAVIAADLDDYEAFVRRELQRVPGIASIDTSFGIK